MVAPFWRHASVDLGRCVPDVENASIFGGGGVGLDAQRPPLTPWPLPQCFRGEFAYVAAALRAYFRITAARALTFESTRYGSGSAILRPGERSEQQLSEQASASRLALTSTMGSVNGVSGELPLRPAIASPWPRLALQGSTICPVSTPECRGSSYRG